MKVFITSNLVFFLGIIGILLLFAKHEKNRQLVNIFYRNRVRKN